MVTPKQVAILRHVARYGVSLRSVIERSIFPLGESSESALRTLQRDGLLASVPNAVTEPTETSTSYGYFHVTRKATGKIGAAESKGKPPGSLALKRRLAILWFCCLGPHEGHLLGDSELITIFPAEASDAKALSGSHALVRGKTMLQVHNLYVSQADSRETLNELRKRVELARTSPALASAIRSKQYVFTILVETETKRDELKALLTENCKTDGFVFHVAMSPGSWRGRPKES